MCLHLCSKLALRCLLGRCGDCDLFRQLGMPSIGQERQTESGVIVMDRERHWLALEWALWLNVHADITYELACELPRWSNTLLCLLEHMVFCLRCSCN